MSRNARNNDTTRPRKSGTAAARRLLEHRRRLVALGVSEDKITTLNHEQLRTYIAKPQLIPDHLK